VASRLCGHAVIAEVRGANFRVEATATRSSRDVLTGDTAIGTGRRSFEIHLGRVARARYVQVYVQTERDAIERRVAILRIRTGQPTRRAPT
jgi:hypothetical protein